MIAEHQTLSEAAGQLAGAAGAAEAAGCGEGIARLFAGHVAKENDIPLPAVPPAPLPWRAAQPGPP